MSYIRALAEDMPQKNYKTTSCTLDYDVFEALEVLVASVKEISPRANRSQVINSILSEKLSELKL